MYLLALNNINNSYSQTIPRRFIKQVLSISDQNKDGMIQTAEFSKFLQNIGAGDKLTKEEIDEIMSYLSQSDGKVTEVSVDKIQEVYMMATTKK